MRLHALEITAFGPFADAVHVDFDALFESSVFLLCGDTGAGKSTVLDAVCFALYGDVPGDRGAARQLRSQHAAPGTAPRVVLELDVAGRRFRFTRSPAWQRPKRRGSGLTTEQARVLVEERTGDSAEEWTWTTRSTRLDEAGHLVDDVIGMTIDQFSQVALLPQGSFDTFLRSSSQDRQRVLTQLFRTRRFEDVERWLVDRRTTLRRASQAQRVAVGSLLHRLSEAADVALPEWDLDRAAQEGELERWRHGLGTALSARRADAEAALEVAERELATAMAAHESGRRAADLRAQHESAHRGSRRLEEESERISADAARLDAAARAETVLPLLRQVERAAVEAARATGAATRAVARASSDLDGEEVVVDPDELAERARLATARAAVAQEFVPRARDLEHATDSLARTAGVIAEAEQARSELAQRLGAVPATLAGLNEEREAMHASAAALAPAQARAAELGRLLAQFAVADELGFQVVDARRRRDEQHRVTLELREQMQDLRERRLAGMAAELASAMAVGSDCPVCGSHDHPAPAASLPDAPTRADEQDLRDRIDDEEVALLALDDSMRNYQARLVAVRQSLGTDTLAATTSALDHAREQVQQAKRAAAAGPDIESRIRALVESERDDRTELGTVDTRLAAARERRASTQEQVTRLSDELAAILEQAGPRADCGTESGVRSRSEPAEASAAGSGWSVAELAAHHERSARLLLVARDALLERARAEELASQARSAALELARERGFADLEEATAAVLGGDALVALRDQVAQWQRLGDEVAQVLADPDVIAASSAVPPDLDALARAREDSTRAHASAATAARLSVQQEQRVAARTVQLEAALGTWEPVRADHERVRSLSELAEGRGSDNTRQMRLSAYVLAARLSQVVAAANERLVRMTDDRFLLEHTAERGVGDRRGGLSLVVRDQWTDEARDPVTLSGGETFVVSLALALGLADVVTSEAGGVRIDTLFVDEGFGSLDADTLELVMDTLDGLRDGGRVVGLVSHVAELRTRIPSQLVVTKTRTGSSLAQRIGAG